MKPTIISILAMIIFGCNSHSSQSSILTQDEYDIYSTIISSHFGYQSGIPLEHRNHDTILVFEKTVPGVLLGDSLESNYFRKRTYGDSVVTLKWFSVSGEWDTLLYNYKKVMSEIVMFDKSKMILPGVNYFISENDKTNNSQYLRTNITVCFSRAGFNLQQNEALVFFNYSEYEGGGSFIILLRKNNNLWSVVKGYGYNEGMMAGFSYYENGGVSIALPAVPKPVIQADVATAASKKSQVL